MPIKEIGTLALKVTIAAGLIYWFVSYGKLDFNTLAILTKESHLIPFLCLVWFTGPLLLCGIRWWLLMEVVGFPFSRKKLLSYQAIGIFFNTVLPGAVSGDLVKVIYAFREHPHKPKSGAVVSTIMDRALGIYALFTIGALVTIARLETIMATPLLQPLALMTIIAFLGLSLTSCLIIIPWQNGDPIAHLLEKPFPLFTHMAKVYNAVRCYQPYSKRLGLCLLLSLCSQGLLCFTFAWIASRMVPGSALGDVAMIFPIGFVTTAIPITPGGLGVGHLAFDQLFAMMNLQGGANVFNVYIIAMLSLNLLGVAPYLLLRKRT